MTMEGAIMLLAMVFSPFWLPKLWKLPQARTPPEEEEECQEEIDIEELEEAVSELQKTVTEIQKMQSAVRKIQACDPETQHSNFRMQWQSDSGKNETYDFWADGDSPTNDILLDLYQAEIDRLTTSLPERVEKIQDIINGE